MGRVCDGVRCFARFLTGLLPLGTAPEQFLIAGAFVIPALFTSILAQNLNPGQDTRAEPKLEGHRNQIEHSEGVLLTYNVSTAKNFTPKKDKGY